MSAIVLCLCSIFLEPLSFNIYYCGSRFLFCLCWFPFVSSLSSSLGYVIFSYHLLCSLSVSPVSRVAMFVYLLSLCQVGVLVLALVFITSFVILMVPRLLCVVFGFGTPCLVSVIVFSCVPWCFPFPSLPGASILSESPFALFYIIHHGYVFCTMFSQLS